ncbi:hypothetical protein P691DRAFT_827956 [Macrolepiota fuliginosa MF-IS2]|uniref:F-box domain-containing protein n=1 Tax=Macrolepiota fuliginosa MF-IS2 TaxID=1400762 RepID=A0A9P5X8W8_9AGAR|nr:hypothetical protein P691DRAFT_827956 [Macrolepiota fuliginosa MF-IS2]
MHPVHSPQERIPPLPLDVWEYIFRFIPDRHLRNLYGVNKLFCEVAMALRYHQIIVDNWADQQWPHCLPRSEAGKKSQSLQRDLPRFLRLLAGVDKLQIDCAVYPIRAPEYLDTRNPYLASGWKTFSANLRSLNVNIYSTYIDRLFTHKIHLERLEELIILVCPENVYSGDLGYLPIIRYQYNEMDTFSKVEKNFAPFINAHANTLNHLYLTAVGTVAFPASFFRLVKHLPHLPRFGLGMPSRVSTKTGTDLTAAIYDFVHLYHTSLEPGPYAFAKVTPQYVAPRVDLQEWFGEALWQLVFRKLDALTFKGIPSQFGSSIKIVEYIRRHISELTELCAEWHEADMEDVGYGMTQDVLKTMSSNQLQRLKIGVEPIYANAFAHAAAHFPNLRKLDFTCSHTGRELVGVHEIPRGEIGIQQFKEDLAALDLPADWPLTDLTFGVPGVPAQFNPFYNDKELSQLILQKFPRVEIFNGRMRDEV